MIRIFRMTERVRRERRAVPSRHRSALRRLQGSPRMLVIVCSVLLASLVAVVSTSPVASADTKTGPSTTGTASTVSPSTVAVGGTIMYTLSGFPSGVTVQVLIDDGALVASRVKKDGTAAGSFELPEYVEQGNHWLRFRVFGAQGESGQEGNAADYTNKSPYFTVSGVTVIGGSAPPTVPPAPTPPPRQVAASGRANGTAAGIQAAGPGGESAGFPIIGAFVLGLSVILVVLSVLVAINRRRMAAYQRRRATA